MITKIESIKGFGIYKNFNWNSTPKIKDFNLKNLFYGWNYSGKTTLARIFSSLRDKKIHDSYKKGVFKIQTTDGEFNSADLSSFPYDLLVFSSDYVKDNLNFSIHEDSIADSNTILFEVGDNAKHEAKIILLKNQIELVNDGKKSKFLKSVEEFESYDEPTIGKFTIFAREIKDEHFISLINFNKTNLKAIISNVKSKTKEHIISDKNKLSSLREIVKISDPKEELNKIQINLLYPEIIENTNQVLNSTPAREVLNKFLDKNPEAYTWVKKGQDLNKANNRCLFCDNIVDEERINYLNEYFSSQASNVIEKVENLKLNIIQEESTIKSINLPSSSNDFNLGFINEYNILKKQYDKIALNYKKYLAGILIKLDAKINKSLYISVENITPFKIETLTNLVEKINSLIAINNEFSSDFVNKINAERDKFKNHLVSSFLKKEKYLLKETKYTKAIAEIEKLDNQIKFYEKEIGRYESLKESDTEGAEQYTYFVQSFLNRSDIEIKLDKDTKKFILLRSNENASNLSEGEKTAIAFSHFLVTIKSLVSKNKFKNFIVFVDDPISSLDGNHIFQINSLFKEMFFSQVPDLKNPKQEIWQMNCKQLFISTHNFDFFNLMKELPKGRLGFDYVNDVKKCKESRYYVERKINEAFIIRLPQIFDDYKSEYHYLFNEIIKFNEDPNKNNSDRLLIMPNILRRFVEMYTLAKYPSKDEVDDRANEVFGKLLSKRILKPLHYFSHFNNIDRIGKHNDLIADLPAACEALIKYLKTDVKHYKALEMSIN